MKSFLEKLEEKVLVAMGAVGTNLGARGMKLGQNAAQWCFNHPEEFRGLIKQYVDINCDILTAASSSANRLILSKYGFQDQTREINIKLARIAKEVVRGDMYVAGTLCSISLATGRFLSPLGDLSFEEVYESYKEQVESLAEGGVDLIWVITMADIEEASTAVRVVKECTDLPVIASMAFNPTSKGFRTIMGVDPQTAARKLQEEGADIVGTNCGGTSIEDTTKIIQEMREACSCYLVAKPNAGTPHLVQGQTVYPVTPEQMVKEVPNWINAGARIISGCCGATSDHITQMITVVNQMKNN